MPLTNYIKDINSFDNFYNSIKKLTNKEKGDIFEEFTKYIFLYHIVIRKSRLLLDSRNELFKMLLQEVDLWKERYPTTDIIVLQAEFQADSVIAYRTMQHLNDMVIMNDSDLVAL